MLEKRMATTLILISLLAGGTSDSFAKARIRVWHPWGGTTAAGLNQLAKQYEKLVPGVQIEMVSVPNSIQTNDKFFTSMAAGTPPEIILVDGTQACQWAAKNVLANLDPLAKRDGVKGSDFWTPSWKQCLWKGKLYSMPFESDANFPLAYNKSVFAECGLPGAPTSFNQMEEYAKKADKSDGTNYSRAGFAPQAIPWWGNILYTWGWAFGANFYDEDKDQYNLDHPKAVDSLDWVTQFYNKRGSKFGSMAGQGYAGLVKGKIGMMPILADFSRYVATEKSAKNFQWGYGFLHGPSESPSAWVGGWTMAIPANAKYQKEAWGFIKWVCWDKQGTESLWKLTGWTPSARTSPVYSAKHDDDVAAYVETLKIADHQRPVSLATPFVFGVLETLGPKVAAGKKSPADALKEANGLVQKELARLTAQTKRK